jgi:hypothetical protein
MMQTIEIRQKTEREGVYSLKAFVQSKRIYLFQNYKRKPILAAK